MVTSKQEANSLSSMRQVSGFLLGSVQAEQYFVAESERELPVFAVPAKMGDSSRARLLADDEYSQSKQAITAYLEHKHMPDRQAAISQLVGIDIYV
jgi:hypothetical protein